MLIVSIAINNSISFQENSANNTSSDTKNANLQSNL